MKPARTLAMLAAAVLLLGGCGDPEEPGQPEPAPLEQETPGDEEPGNPDDDGETSGDQPTGDQPAEEHDDERVRAAAADLAERTGTDPAQVRVVQFRAVTWPDGSIGCPEPGMSYTQALVDGYRLILQADGAQYHYHAAGEGDLVLCTDPQEPLDHQ